MDSEITFSLSYAQLTVTVEEEIRKCDLRKTGEHYVLELNRASEIRRLWYLLALQGYLVFPDITRVESDRQRLDDLIQDLQRT